MKPAQPRETYVRGGEVSLTIDSRGVQIHLEGMLIASSALTDPESIKAVLELAGRGIAQELWVLAQRS